MRDYSDSGVGRCSSKGVHLIELRAQRAKNFHHAHFCPKTTPIFGHSRSCWLLFLGCINEEMNGKPSRAHFVMCSLIVRPSQDGECAYLGVTPFLCHCMPCFLWAGSAPAPGAPVVPTPLSGLYDDYCPNLTLLITVSTQFGNKAT